MVDMTSGATKKDESSTCMYLFIYSLTHLEETPGPAVQFAVGDLHVDHVVLINLPLQDMSAGAHCVQHQLGRELPLLEGGREGRRGREVC